MLMRLADPKVFLEALKTGRFHLSVHAAERMMGRSVMQADIRAYGRTAISCLHQPGKGTFKVEGLDLDGQPLTIICAADDTVVMVTIF
jgi:hypothetical protein